MEKVLNVLLSHQAPAALEKVLHYWNATAPGAAVLLAHGGAAADFAALHFQPRLFVDDPRLRTRDHQRDAQSLTGLLREVRKWLLGQEVAFTHLHFIEFDHLPLVADLNARQLERSRAENADVLAFHLQRIDGTSHPHFLAQDARAEFAPWLAALSRRDDPAAIFSMLGTGSFWTREAFDAVAECEEPFPIYYELYLPTLAHHLGFRLRDFAEQNAFVSHRGERGAEMNEARARGAWSLHPVKQIPSAHE
ncbi:MAG: hypothetical protein M3Y86_13490 [Verrucomicrobiota bacterium]|nr:hypothetical protein [Verrucomicrobiota bacterium]